MDSPAGLATQPRYAGGSSTLPDLSWGPLGQHGVHNEAVAHRDSPTKVPGLAILLTDNFIEQVFTGGVLLKKPLLEKFYWRSFTGEVILSEMFLY